MIILMYIALGYLIITSLILRSNGRRLKKLEEVPSGYFERQAPEVCLCIPARNEEESIERCVRSALNQEYPNTKVYVLDDESTDDTTATLERLQEQFPQKLNVLQGKPKPESWLGKPWACHQLSEAAAGDILLFIDADTWLDCSVVAKTVRRMGRDVLDFMTIWPMQKLGTFWEKMVIPLIYMAVFTLLPITYVRRPPKWIPPLLRSATAAFFTAACGQFMAFKRTSYETIGGHESVKDEVVEDVALARNIKRAGLSMNMYHGDEVIWCRMYRSHQKLWHGLRKNFLAGFGYRIFPFILTGFLQFIVYILPVLILPFLLNSNNPLLLALCSAAILLLFIQRIYLSRWFNWNSFYALLHPLGVAWFQVLGARVLLDHYTDKSAYWKDRKL